MDQDGDFRGPDGFEENVETWALPLDAYRPDSRYTDYAYALVLRDCVRTAGIEVEIEVRPVAADERPSATTNDAGRELFTLQTAQTYGYHRASPGDREPPAELALEIDAQAAYDSCLVSADQEMPTGPYGELAQYLQLGAWYGATLDPSVVQTAEEWRECLDSQTEVNLPMSPLDMPTQEMQSAFGLDVELYADGLPSPEMADELALAEADFRCQESSGFRSAFYAAEVLRNNEAYDSNLDALEFAAVENSKLLEMAEAIVLRLG